MSSDFPDYEAANQLFDAVLNSMFGEDRKFALDVTVFVDAALGDETLYRVDRTHKRKRATDPVKYVRVWPKEER